jgi:uncharacterized protein YceK
LKLLWALLVIFTLSGCATVGTLNKGEGQTYLAKGHSFDEVWDAAIKVVSRSLTIVDLNKNAGKISAESKSGMTTWGEVIAVYVSKGPDDERTYEVISQKRLVMQITGQDWTLTIGEGIRVELK